MVNIVASIKVEEKEEIQLLFERINSLKGLNHILLEKKDDLQTDNDMFNQVDMELQTATHDFNNWWNKMKEKYNLYNYDAGKLYVDFGENNLKLVE